jgi:hypothetical protein
VREFNPAEPAIQGQEARRWESGKERSSQGSALLVGFGADCAQEAEEFVVVDGAADLFALESFAAELLEIFGSR